MTTTTTQLVTDHAAEQPAACPFWCSSSHNAPTALDPQREHEDLIDAVTMVDPQAVAEQVGRPLLEARVYLQRYDARADTPGPVNVFLWQPEHWDCGVDLDSAERVALALLMAVRLGRGHDVQQCWIA